MDIIVIFDKNENKSSFIKYLDNVGKDIGLKSYETCTIILCFILIRN